MFSAHSSIVNKWCQIIENKIHGCPLCILLNLHIFSLLTQWQIFSTFLWSKFKIHTTQKLISSCKSWSLASIFGGPAPMPLAPWPLLEECQGSLPNVDPSPEKVKNTPPGYLNWSLKDKHMVGSVDCFPVPLRATEEYRSSIKTIYLLIWFVLTWLDWNFCVTREFLLENILKTSQRRKVINGIKARCYCYAYPASSFHVDCNQILLSFDAK